MKLLLKQWHLFLAENSRRETMGRNADNILKKAAAGSAGDGQSKGAYCSTGTDYGGDGEIGTNGK